MAKLPKKCCGTCKHWDRESVLKKRNGKPADFSPSECLHPMVELPVMPEWLENGVNPNWINSSRLMCGSYGTRCKTWEKA